MTRHLLELDDLSTDELVAVLDLAERPALVPVLAGRSVALLFERPSLRTRAATEAAVGELGGHPVSLRGDEIGLVTREPLPDIARVLSGYHAVIGARVALHSTLETLAESSSVPVVNLLSDAAHPLQALADALTLRRHFGRLEGLALAYVGDFNNVARSLAVLAAHSGIDMRIASPAGYGPTDEEVARLAATGARVRRTDTPHDAVVGADAVYTDVWASMGQESEADERRRAFEGFSVDADLMASAGENAVFMHCLPAHRGEEVAAEVIDGPRSVVWEQATNRLPTTKALLAWLVHPPVIDAGGRR